MEHVPGQDAQARDRTLPRLHFLDGTELPADRLTALLDRALALKAAPAASRPLEGRTVERLFEKPSTRTRVSFEAGVVELVSNGARQG